MFMWNYFIYAVNVRVYNWEMHTTLLWVEIDYSLEIEILEKGLYYLNKVHTTACFTDSSFTVSNMQNYLLN